MVVKERLGCKTILKPDPMGKLIDPDAFRINKSSRISVSRCRRYPEWALICVYLGLEVYLVKGSGSPNASKLELHFDKEFSR